MNNSIPVPVYDENWNENQLLNDNNTITINKRRTSSKSPRRSSLGRHIPGSVYCVTAGLHHHTSADLQATKTPPRRSISQHPATHIQRSRSATKWNNSLSHTYKQTHTLIDKHSTHSHADYNVLLSKLDHITELYNQLLLDAQSRSHCQHNELEHERELRYQKRLAESELLLRKQLSRERDDERTVLEQRLNDRDTLIIQLENQLSITRNSDNQTIHTLKLDIDRMKLEYNTLKRETAIRVDDLVKQSTALTDENKQLHHDLNTVQKSVLSTSEDNIRLRYELRELNNRLNDSETQQQRLERLSRERVEDDIRMNKLRDAEMADRLQAEQRLKQQLSQHDAMAERNRLHALNESKLSQYYIDGKCAWQSGILNRSLLMVPNNATGT